MYFGYVMVARASPAIPNWLISLASPHFHIPLAAFFLATVVGVAPLGWICVKTGGMVKQAVMVGAIRIWTWENVGWMGMMGVVGLVPGLVQKWWRRRRRQQAKVD